MLKNTIWLIIVIGILAILGYYNYISWNVTIVFSIIYLFITALIIEREELKAKEGLKNIITSKIESIENLLFKTVQKIEADTRIKDRISQKKREVIEWLSKL